MKEEESLRVLLVEDNRADAVLLQEMLVRAQPGHFDIIWEDRLGKASARLEGQAFDVVLLDLSLPDSQGLATLEAIHGVAVTVPIVVVTGAEDENLALQAIRQGAQDYLVKGTLSARGMARVIHYAVDRRRVEENLRESQRREMAAEALATAARTAQDTIRAMSEGVLILDMKGRILSVNPAMEQLTGINSQAVIGHGLAELMPQFVAVAKLAFMEDALQTALEGRLPELHPFTMHSVTGGDVSVIPAAAFIRGADGEAVSLVVTFRDITLIRQAQDAVESSEKKYRELVESANSIIMRRRLDGTVTFLNGFALNFFGFRAEEIVGRNVVGTIVPEKDSEGRDLAAMIQDIGARPEAYISNENENICKDGRRVWVQWTNRALLNAAGEVYEVLCVGADATARKNAEEASRRYQLRLRSLSNRLASTEEEERRRISRYIHDTVIQSLALANIKMGSLRQGIEKRCPGEELKKLETARELIQEGIAECRQLMSDLAPAMLYELGLEQALDDLVEKLSRQHEVDIRLEGRGPYPVADIPLRGLLFQSTRELIVNALKHSGASLIQVYLESDGTTMTVTVKDNGNGFSMPGSFVPRRNGEGGFGLFNIKERVEGLGGTFSVTSEPGQGTRAVITAPLGQPPAARAG